MNRLLVLNVDDANYILREGLATKAHAEEFCRAWNDSDSKPNTRCYVTERTRIMGGCCEVAYPVIFCEHRA